MTRTILLALALAGVSSVAQAQTARVVQGCGQQALKLNDSSGDMRDANGNLCVNSQPFLPKPGASVVVTAGPTATTAGTLALAAAGTFPAGTVTSYRVRNAASSASPITWVLTTSNTATPVIPTPYTAAGTGGTVGDKTIDPGNTEYFGLTAAQQTALAAGTLYLSVVTPGGGSGTLSITPGNGS